MCWVCCIVIVLKLRIYVVLFELPAHGLDLSIKLSLFRVDPPPRGFHRHSWIYVLSTPPSSAPGIWLIEASSAGGSGTDSRTSCPSARAAVPRRVAVWGFAARDCRL